jgi:hypothetical protein
VQVPPIVVHMSASSGIVGEEEDVTDTEVELASGRQQRT